MRKKIAAVLASLLLLAGCSSTREGNGPWLWFPVEAGAPRGSAEVVRRERYDGPLTVEGLIQALRQGPQAEELSPLFANGVAILDWRLADGVLSLYMSTPYGELARIDRTLLDSCFMLTLCQADGVERVRFSEQGLGQPLQPADLLFSGAEEEPREVDAVLYFPRALGKGLGFETRQLILTEDDDLYSAIAEAFLSGPDDPDLHTLFPEGTALLGAWVDDGVCCVNFSQEFLSAGPQNDIEQNLLLYSIVDTMGNLSAVTAVQVLVEGERLSEFGSQDASHPLEPDFGLLNGD